MATPYNSNYVGGEGPVPCRFMLVGEGPGEDEDRAGRPFVGKSGVELWRCLWRGCALTRDDVYVTNLVKFRVPDNGDPTEEDIARDVPELVKEILRVQPEIVISLGRWSTRWFLGDVDMDAVHGVAHRRNGLIVLPCIHPAAGLHNTEFQAKIAWDFEQAGKAIRGQADAPVERFDGHLDPVYGESNAMGSPAGVVAVDTEGSVARPWCASWSDQPGRAVLSRRGPLKFQHIILHNSLHDIGVLEALWAEYESFDDTMVMAYLLGIEPQGLKNLARRHCGMVMQDYSELVWKAGRVKADDYLRRAIPWLNKHLHNESEESSTTSGPGRKRTSGRGGKKSSRTRRRA